MHFGNAQNIKSSFVSTDLRFEINFGLTYTLLSILTLCIDCALDTDTDTQHTRNVE